MTRLRKYLLLNVLLCCVLAACSAPGPAPTSSSKVHQLSTTPLAADVPENVESIQPIWKTLLTGAVNVAPVVLDDLVITATADGRIHAVDAATGAMVWRFEPTERLWDASLRAAESKICVGLQGGLVTCLDPETGEPLWITAVGQEVQSRPALEDGKLYVPTTHVGTGLENNYDGKASLISLDAGTGKVLWEAETDNFILRRPVVAGDRVLTGGVFKGPVEDGEAGLSRIYAFDKSTGEELWVHESEDGLMRWLVDADDIVAFSGGSEVVRALNPESGNLEWSFGPSYWMQFPAVAGGLVLMGTGDERFFALDAATGEVVWDQSIDLDSLSQIGRPLLRDGTIWFNAVTGDIYALQQSDGKQIAHLNTGITSRVGGALFENLYIMGDPEGALYAYEIR